MYGRDIVIVLVPKYVPFFYENKREEKKEINIWSKDDVENVWIPVFYYFFCFLIRKESNISSALTFVFLLNSFFFNFIVMINFKFRWSWSFARFQSITRKHTNVHSFLPPFRFPYF